MSGFDPVWLDLREPADHRARAPSLVAKVAALFGGRPSIHVADLASGSGSTLRALAPHLGTSQRWTLIDHDPALLIHARSRLAGWADAAETDGGLLRLRKGGRSIEVATEIHDLSRTPLPLVAASADLVTASAFFDLVGEVWLDGFVAALAASDRPLYAALSYAGLNSFAPAHPLDAEVLAAFHVHQHGDKGFGPALGPLGGARLQAALERAGYACAAAESPWELAPEDGALTAALADGMAQAAAETASPPQDLAAWAAFRARCAESGSAHVGHVDLLGLRP